MLWSVSLLVVQTVVAGFNAYFETLFSPCHKNKIISLLKIDVYKNIVDSDFENYDNEEYMDKYLYSQEKYLDAFFKIEENIFSTIEAILVGCTTFAVIATINIYILVLIALFVCLNVIFSMRKAKVDFNNSKEQQHNNSIISFIFRVFNSKSYSYEIKIYKYFSALKKQLKETYAANSVIQKKWGKSIAVYSTLVESLSYVFEFAAILILYLVSLRKTMTVGDFSLIINASWNLAYKIKDIFQLVPEIYSASLIVEEFNTMKNYPRRLEGMGDTDISYVQTIEFKNVSFHYTGMSHNQLEDINLSIKKGERVAIVGENGSGKSTLIKLLLRLYSPSEGNIQINGVDLKEISNDFFRLNIGQAMQQNQILPLTIKDYISGVCEDVSSAKLLEALSYSGFGDVMKRKNLTLNSRLAVDADTSAFSLSGGEAQKLFVARAYAQKSNLFIFDEPSSALDPKSENELFNRMCSLSKDKIIIFITHHMLSTVNADKIILLNKGSDYSGSL